MQTKSMFIFASILSLATACTIADLGDTGGGTSAPTYADTATDTIGTKKSTEGLTGLMALSDVFSSSAQIVNAKILLSADFSQATIYINGVQAGVLDQVAVGLSLYATDTSSLTMGGLDTDYYGIGYYTDGTMIGHVVAGVETRPENLPTATSTYIGLWQVAIGQMGGDVGFSEFNIDFGAGTFTGALTDGVVVNATLTGVVIENGLDSTATFSGDYSGVVDLMATFFGPVGEDLAGVLAGTVSPTSGGADESLIGNFSAFRLP